MRSLCRRCASRLFLDREPHSPRCPICRQAIELADEEAVSALLRAARSEYQFDFDVDRSRHGHRDGFAEEMGIPLQLVRGEGDH